MYISEIKSDSNTLNLTLKNTGRFNIDGVFVYYSDDEDKQTATENLGNYLTSGGAFLGVDISFEGNALKPNSKQELNFSNINNLNIKFIEIIPAKNQKVKNKIVPVTCGEGKVKRVVLEGCTDGQKRNCPLQQGVCLGSQETCVSSVWSGCLYTIYNLNYQPSETRCSDNLDNDCDGLIDESPPC